MSNLVASYACPPPTSAWRSFRSFGAARGVLTDLAGRVQGKPDADRDENPVRVFATFTEDLAEMARWLTHCGITTAAMESTGGIGFYFMTRWSDTA